MNKTTGFDAFSSVTVGVADMEIAKSLWIDQFGMSIVAKRTGNDAATAALWGISPNDISQQLLLSTGSSRYGMLHLVEFNNPEPAVRLGAAVFDRVPKNLDVYVRDMPQRLAELAMAGHEFRNDEFSEVTAPDGTVFREMHMPSHDSINVVLLEVLGKEKPLTDKGYGSIGPLIYIVADAESEKAFVHNVFSFDKLNDNVLSGPEIEEMVGLPPGAALDVSIWGHKEEPLGELEIIEYRGVEGRDLYARARPKSTGVLHLNFRTDDLEPLLERLTRLNVEFEISNAANSILGNGRALVFYSPAGLRMEVHEVPLIP